MLSESHPGRMSQAYRRVRTRAAEVLGSGSAAEDYMHTRNFALGGATPMELLAQAGGESSIMRELDAAEGGGPV